AHTRMRPGVWKRSLRLSGDKERARLRAMQLFPGGIQTPCCVVLLYEGTSSLLLAAPARSSWTLSRPIKSVRGLLPPSLCVSLVMGEPPFAHPKGRFALLHSHTSVLQDLVEPTAAWTLQRRERLRRLLLTHGALPVPRYTK